MIDELDLAFEEHPDRGRHRHRRTVRTKKRKKKRRRGRTFLALFLVLLMFGGLGGAVWYGFDRISAFLLDTPDYDSAGTVETTFEVKKDETLTEIANGLYTAGIIKSAKAFLEAADREPRSRNIQAGVYKIRKQMRAADALSMLLDLKNRMVNGITIPEGLISVQIYEKLSQATKIPIDQFKEAGKDPVKLGVPQWWFNRLDKKQSAKNIEGFLFPATYEFPPNATAEQILRLMVQKFLDVTTEMKFDDTVQRQRNISPYEALITASIAQAEVQTPEDLAKVARVVYNRVYTGTFECGCLGLDAAVNYWFKSRGMKSKDPDHFTQSEIHDPKNPYNTHDVPGLPVGPISNPGEAALRGAMNPPSGPWTYFVTIDKQGTMAFAADWAGHQRNIATACKNGVLTGESC